jgi:hypothetical protein
LALSPQDRVRAAALTADAIPRRGQKGARKVIPFADFEDFLNWKDAQAIRR